MRERLTSEAINAVPTQPLAVYSGLLFQSAYAIVWSHCELLLQVDILSARTPMSSMLACIKEYVCASLERIASHTVSWDKQSGRTVMRMSAVTPSLHFFELSGSYQSRAGTSERFVMCTYITM